MSSLPPKAEIPERSRDVCFTLMRQQQCEDNEGNADNIAPPRHGNLSASLPIYSYSLDLL
jgi:hypothetical protein